MEEKEMASVGMNVDRRENGESVNAKTVDPKAKGDANPNNANAKGDANPNAKKNDKEKKKKAGIIIGVVGLSVAAAIAAAAGAKGCAPNERSYTVTYLTDDEVQNFQGGSVSVKEGTTIGDLKRQLAPLDGYEVEGFYKDPDCTLEFRDDEKVNDDTKIYIEYKEIEITLIFHNKNNPSDNNFDNMTVMYFDNLSKKEMPTPENYSTDEGNYTFNCWKTLDGKVVNLKNMTSGKDLLAIDADGEIDLYAEFDFEKVELSYSVTIPDIIKVTRNGEELENLSEINLNDELVITARDDTDWIATSLKVNGQDFSSGNTFTVEGDVTIEVTDAEHRYLIFTLKDDQTYEVRGMKEGANETNIVIPDNHYDEKAITSIYGYYNSYSDNGGAFYNKKTIQSVVIGNNVTSIGKYAFCYCDGLTSMTIPSSVTSIGDSAFEECSSLSSVTYKGTADEWVNNQLSKGFDYAFDLTTSEGLLTEYTFNSDVPDYALAHIKSLTSVTFGEGCKSIGERAFYGCNKLQSVIIGENVTGIGYSAFRSCVGLTEIIWNAANATYFGSTHRESNDVFYGAGKSGDGVTVTFGDNVQRIPDYCLCSSDYASLGSIKSVTIGENVTSIGKMSFYTCSGLTEIIWNAANVKDFGSRVFDYAGRDSGGITVTFGDSVQNIPANCFKTTDNTWSARARITSIVIGENVQSIGASVFENCTDLRSVTIKGSATSIGQNAFYRCSGLKNVYFMGNEDAWTSFQSNIGTGNEKLTSAHIYYYEQTNPYTDHEEYEDDKYWHYEGDDTTTPVVWTREDQ